MAEENRPKRITDSYLAGLKPKATRYKKNLGDRLSLFVSPNGKKVFRMIWDMGRKSYTIGPYPEISLLQANRERDRINALLAQGLDPNEEKRQREEEERRELLRREKTLQIVALEWWEKYQRDNLEHEKKIVLSRLQKDVFPTLGSKPIADISRHEVADLLQAVEKRSSNIAHRLQGYLTRIFDYAVDDARIIPVNPVARLRVLAPKPPEKHRPAIHDPKKFGQLLRDIETYWGADPSVAYALRLVPYLFVRSVELRKAKWADIQLEGDSPQWIIPAQDMKGRKGRKAEHVVPLARQVVPLFRELQKFTGDREHVFYSGRAKDGIITGEALLSALRSLGYSKDEMCIHGFRGSASTTMNVREMAGPDVIEWQLAHIELNKVRRAYNAAEYLPQRRKLMQEWADLCDRLRAGTT